jgi:hypothetical protein
VCSSDLQIEQYCGREFHIESRTEYFDVDAQRYEFWPKAAPVLTLTSTHEDPDGEWDGDESEITDSFIGINGESVVLPEPVGFQARKAVRVIYTGGLAYHGVRSTFVVAAGADFTVARYVKGGTSLAKGIVRTAASTSLVVENLYGIFEAGETLTEYTDEACTAASGITEAIVSITYQSLAEAHPDLVRVCEIQCRQYHKHKSDFEITGTNQDGSTNRQGNTAGWVPFLAEARNLLEPYRRFQYA